MSTVSRLVKGGLKTATAVGGILTGMGIGYGIAVVRVKIQSAMYPKFWAESARTVLNLDNVPPSPISSNGTSTISTIDNAAGNAAKHSTVNPAGGTSGTADSGTAPSAPTSTADAQRRILTVNVLGDSAASGVGASRPERGYVGLLMRRLAEETGRDVHVTNISVPGASSWLLMEKQLPILKELPPADITMSVIGANDLIDPKHTVEGFRWTAESLYPQLPPGTVVSTIPSFGAPWLDPKVRAANDIITSVVKDHDLELADLYSHTKELGFWRYLLYTGGDIFHPSERGYVVWAAAIWPALKRAARRAGAL